MPKGIESNAETLLTIFQGDVVISVPQYQRAYSWRNQNINDLWDTLAEAVAEERSDRTAFLGSLVFHRDEGSTDLVDGQQRLATLSLILGAMRHGLLRGSPNDSISRGRVITRIEDLLFVHGDPDLGARLNLSDRDRLAFKDYMMRGTASRPPPGLKRGWSLINKLYNEDVAAHGNELQFAEELLDVIRQTVTFSVVTVADPHNPFAVFESLNSKGQDLAQSDLIKNRVLQKAVVSSRDELSEKWERMVAELESHEVTYYLRTWWTASEKRVTIGSLYRSAKNKISDPTRAEFYLERWYNDSILYKGLVQGHLSGVSDVAKSALKEFADLGFKQARAVMLGLLLKEANGSQLQRAVIDLSRIYIRVLKTAQQRGSKFESRVDRICAAIRNDLEDGLTQLRMASNELCKGAGNLDWSDFVVDDRKFARYLLVRLAAAQEGTAWGSPDASQLEVEHVLPLSRIEGQLDGIPEVDYDRLVNNIGNQTLLVSTDNLAATNKAFERKKAIYAKYGSNSKPRLRMTAELASFDFWGEDSIRTRAKVLAERAEEIWPKHLDEVAATQARRVSSKA